MRTILFIFLFQFTAFLIGVLAIAMSVAVILFAAQNQNPTSLMVPAPLIFGTAPWYFVLFGGCGAIAFAWYKARLIRKGKARNREF